MMRASLAGGRVSPFVHVGLADVWRPGAAVDDTFLYREIHEPQ
jgi:hypothetical protein